ncbi:homoserine dehydrogenase [Paucilactobacillus oligofermentans DSM 15707 = LMG 22743]|uniref:Homoserine dehydrogenase n=1 Tax=Paucilactobacillus oligofermentans DSM 15707 = LMG 22743 TaxID=1423778 RepID=A0A0R1RML2_9LACO|nr:homoserine dehydrogenase [Paucilactobacillus oligofermentans]KRL55333.1 homoserine dehydrogenase [Paucilactobacillus oligofermentans DSM 15707 = LMG 22743]CUS25676.1 Homoserine dehydrogenase [Paucilactobacillus oligofermentans DSM 15707 = LMG 22743]
MEKINIGLIGLGTVGSGVLEMISNNQDKISNITGRELIIKTIVVRNVAKHREEVADDILLTDDVNDVINDPDIKIAVEVMGGINPAKQIITDLLNAHKHVVTANKDLIASHGDELAKIAHKNTADLVYEASVAGGIPILRTIVNSFAADEILEVKGIVNGTTNYILTQMQQKSWSYEDALKKAQELGFAESDPTNDVAGIDATYKMIILSQFSFGSHIALEDINIEGIQNIKLEDVTQAAKFGYTIKLLGIATRVGNGIFAEVAPVLVPSDHPLATIHNENNAVMVTGQAVGETLFYGPGAGGLPTANSVLSDIVSVTKNIVLGTTGNTFNNYQHESEPIDKSNVIYPYYLSLQMKDIPGQILKVTKLMTELGASFSQIVQTKANDTEARVIFITHSMSKDQLKTLKEEIAKFDSISLNAAYKVLEN